MNRTMRCDCGNADPNKFELGRKVGMRCLVCNRTYLR